MGDFVSSSSPHQSGLVHRQYKKLQHRVHVVLSIFTCVKVTFIPFSHKFVAQNYTKVLDVIFGQWLHTVEPRRFLMGILYLLANGAILVFF